MSSEKELNILKKQVEMASQKQALEEKYLEVLRQKNDQSQEYLNQEAKVKAMNEANLKIKEKELSLEIELSDKIEEKASRMKKLAAVGTAFVTVLDKMQDLIKRGSDNTRSTADAMGVNVNEARKLNTEILAQMKGSNKYNTNLKDSVATMGALNDAYGGAMKFTAEQAVNLDVASKRLGISSSEAANFSKLMFETSGATLETSTNLMAGIKSLSDASGVKFSSVMKDIAASGAEMARTFGMSGDEIGIMAVAARRLGFELNDVVNMNKSLLDVEGSIEKQMIANVMTGKNMNLDKARALAIEGDHEAMLKEVVAQAGDLDGLNSLQISALNEALGVDILKLKNAKELEKTRAEDAKKAQEIAETEALIREGKIAEFGLQLERDEAAATGEERRMNFENNMLDIAAQQLEDSEHANNLAMVFQGIQMVIQGLMVAQSIAAMVKAQNEKKAAAASAAQLPKLGAEVGLRTASATAALTTNAAATFGLGTVIAMAAVALGVGALLGYMMTSPSPAPATVPTGDLGIDPNGGPIVMSPQEGGIFQGTKNDGVSMSPSHGTKGGGNGSINLKPLLDKMDQLIAAVHKGRVLSVDGYALNEAIHLEKAPMGL
jgi:hypothetical protein